MVTLIKAKELVEKATGEQVSSCAFYDNFYIFTFKGSPFLYKAVNKSDGKIYNFTPSLDYIGYCEAKKVTF